MIKNTETLFEIISKSFYKEASKEIEKEWLKWIEKWINNIFPQECKDGEVITNQMKKANPKYIPREWMLREAYTAA